MCGVGANRLRRESAVALQGKNQNSESGRATLGRCDFDRTAGGKKESGLFPAGFYVRIEQRGLPAECSL